ncbi:MAG: restriction endonuclease subunit S [Bacteroidia bacterium]|nr:restriction endonuclease subunit S [Bacteroidia bacterium]
MKQGWEIKKLSEIGKIFNGNSINENVKKENYTYLDDGFPFIATKDVSFENEINYENGVKIPFIEKSQFKIAPPKTPLICVEGGSAGRKIGFTNQDVCFGNKLFALVPSKNVESKYVFYYYFTSVFQKHFSTEMAGLIGGVSMNKFKEIEIPLPIHPEQQRIVALLDESFASIAKAKANAEQNLKNAKELFESYLQSVFAENGKGWDNKRLGDTCELIMGQSPPGISYNSNNNGVPLINGPVEFGKEPFSKTIKSKFTTEPTKFCKENDLILCVRGSTTGRINIAGFDACIGRGVAAIRYSKNQFWLNYFILANRQKIYDLGSGATFPNVSTDILKKLIIPVPPHSEQEIIVQKLDALSAETKKLETIYQQKLNDLEELKKSVLQKAFNGELKTGKN